MKIKMLLVFFLISLTLSENVLKYSFHNGDLIVNTGSKYRDGDDLEWMDGSKVEDPTGSGHLTMNPRVDYHYKTMNPIRGLRSTFLKSGGFIFNFNFQLTYPNNYESEFCLFCLLEKKVIDSTKFEPCDDLDFGVIWTRRFIKVYLTTLRSNGCERKEYPIFMDAHTGASPLNLTVKLTSLETDIWMNGKKFITRKDTKYEHNDVSTWVDEHQIFIGAKKTSTYQTYVKLYDLAMSPLEEEVKEEVIDYPFKRFSIPQPYQSHGYRKVFLGEETQSCPLNDYECIHGRHGDGCQRSSDCEYCASDRRCMKWGTSIPKDERKCFQSVECLIHKEPSDFYSYSSVNDLLELQYRIQFKGTKRVNHEEKLNGAFQCSDGYHTLLLDWKETVKRVTHCNETLVKDAQYESVVTLGQLYECATGRDKRLLKEENIQLELEKIKTLFRVDLFNISGGSNPLYTKHCQFDLQSTFKKDEKQNMILVNQVNQGAFTTEMKSMVYQNDDDVYIQMESCFPRYDLLTNKTNTLYSTRLLDQNGPELVIDHISGPFHESSKLVDCYKWIFKSNGRYFRENQIFKSNFLFSNQIADLLYGFQVFVYHNKKKEPFLAPHQDGKSRASQTKHNLFLCFYNDQAMTQPYQKHQVIQKIYFKIGAYVNGKPDCVSKVCPAPMLTFKLQKLGLCDPKKALPPSRRDMKCEELGGKLSTIIDLSDPYQEVYTRTWQPEIYPSECPSIILGSFVERSFISPAFQNHPTFLQFSGVVTDLPPMDIHHYRNLDGKIARFQVSTEGIHTWLSSFGIGGCPTGYVYDPYYGACVSWWWNFLWFTLQSLIIAIMVGGLLLIAMYIFRDFNKPVVEVQAIVGPRWR